MTRLRPALLLALVTLAGCGGGDDDTKTPAPADTSATPQETLRAAQDAVRDLDSYHVEGFQSDEDGKTGLVADVAAGGGLRLSLKQKVASVEMIITAEEVLYVRGDEPFWAQTDAPAQVRELLAGRWVKAPLDEDTRRLYEQVQPDVLADCLGDRLGTLSSRRGTLDGQAVVILTDKGDRPGTAPGELYVAAESPALPLRVRETGNRKAGPPPDPRCGEADDDKPGERSDLRLSRFGEPVDIEVPPDALDLEELARQADGESTV